MIKMVSAERKVLAFIKVQFGKMIVDLKLL